ncbi:hypothetical protein [Virgibacillus ndiopensis]|uniref:hypothetical protein n=1 Tax=Virgibacillus ndiopensis TaxID=2004408 RepID=UPI000C08BCA3|nr:hypothetical protein [Virgibacillus ndiopensis]
MRNEFEGRAEPHDVGSAFFFMHSFLHNAVVSHIISPKLWQYDPNTIDYEPIIKNTIQIWQNTSGNQSNTIPTK